MPALPPSDPPIHECDSFPERAGAVERQTAVGTGRNREDAARPIPGYAIDPVFRAQREYGSIAVAGRIPIARGSSRPINFEDVNPRSVLGTVQYRLYADPAAQNAPQLRRRMAWDGGAKEWPGLQVMTFDYPYDNETGARKQFIARRRLGVDENSAATGRGQ